MASQNCGKASDPMTHPSGYIFYAKGGKHAYNGGEKYNLYMGRTTPSAVKQGAVTFVLIT